MINYRHLQTQLAHDPLFSEFANQLASYTERGLSLARYGDLKAWYSALERLPDIKPSAIELADTVTIGTRADTDDTTWQQMVQCMEELIPWRKGPYHIFDLHIDTEWRSDWKWERIQQHISPLQHRTVLDVGCGNGYHCLRSYGAGAKRVIGIDPSPRFVVQFYMLKKYLGDIPVDIVPAGIEDLPENMQAFDTTFSMGVLYHRRSPLDHLRELKDTLVTGGELVLETLVIEGGLGEVLVPEGRYAKMNNVWFLPSVASLKSWLKKCGFVDIQTINVTATSCEEQRATPWMRFQSLPDFLDPKDPNKTIEGHPAPLRAVIRASKA